MKIIKHFIVFLFITTFISSCIKDDFIFDMQDPVLRIVNPIDTLAIGTNYQFEAMYFNNIGLEEDVDLIWKSTDENIISISNDGIANGLQLGETRIIASYDNGDILLSDSISLNVGEFTISNPQQFMGTVNTTSSYALQGDFIIKEEGDGVIVEFFDDYQASTALPGLYVYLSNNPNSVSNAYEIGAVQVFSGAHSYIIPNTSIFDYTYVVYFCKPFNVKVGHGEIIQ